ncbi:MAG: hypothetical protein JEY94_19245 [Melioribacteraceae bacterium]|nr:hypothetical protein [Melioribacteraceae bacterium]
MSDNSSKWIFGCGIGCGAVFLIVVAIFASVYFLVKDTVEEVKMISETSELLESRFGNIYNYIPKPDGTIDKKRIITFLEIRDSLNLMSAELKSEIEKMTDKIAEVENNDEGDSSFWNVLGIIKGGFGVIPEIIKYYSNRNMILFQKEMGLGEYNYLYAISYYSFLKKYPGDGPDIQLMEGGGEFKINSDKSGEFDGREVKLRRNDKIRRYVNKMTRKMYENTLKDLSIDEFWKTAFETEIIELENNLLRLPWEDGLPENMKNSLNSFEKELNDSYNILLNSVELIEIDEVVKK